MKKRYQQLLDKLWLGLALLFVAMGSGWVGDLILEQIKNSWKLNTYYLMGMGVLLFAIGTSYIYIKRRNFLPVQTIGNGAPPQRVKALIINLSSLNKVLPAEQFKMLLEGTDPPFSYERLQQEYPGCNWLSLFEAVQYHQPVLRYLYLSTSMGDNGSAQQFTLARQALHRFIEIRGYPAVLIEQKPEPYDFNNLDEGIRAVREAITLLKHQHRLKEHDIVVDITGGTKMTSLAASMALQTYPGLQFQYYDHGGKRFLAYDCVSRDQSEIE